MIRAVCECGLLVCREERRRCVEKSVQRKRDVKEKREGGGC